MIIKFFLSFSQLRCNYQSLFSYYSNFRSLVVIYVKNILAHCGKELKKEVSDLKVMKFEDVIEFVDAVSNGFLSDLCLSVQLYNGMF